LVELDSDVAILGFLDEWHVAVGAELIVEFHGVALIIDHELKGLLHVAGVWINLDVHCIDSELLLIAVY
jgi:hypothetical protein